MINIQEIIPFMKDGWVAMDENGDWYWYYEKPMFLPTNRIWKTTSSSTCKINTDCFDIAPADDWIKSLIQVKGNKDD